MIRPDLSLPIPDDITPPISSESADPACRGSPACSSSAASACRGPTAPTATGQPRGTRASPGRRYTSATTPRNLADDVDTVVHSGAIWPENPRVRAGQGGACTIHRSQALYGSSAGAGSCRSPVRTARRRRPA